MVGQMTGINSTKKGTKDNNEKVNYEGKLARNIKMDNDWLQVYEKEERGLREHWLQRKKAGKS